VKKEKRKQKKGGLVDENSLQQFAKDLIGDRDDEEEEEIPEVHGAGIGDNDVENEDGNLRGDNQIEGGGEAEDAEGVDNEDENKEVGEDDEDEIYPVIPEYLRKRPKIDTSLFTKAEKSVRNMLESSLPSSEEFDSIDQILDEEQLEAMDSRSKSMPNLWQVNDKFKKPMQIMAGNIGRAMSDKAFFEVEKVVCALERINTGLMVDIAEGKKAEAMGKSMEVYKGLLHIGARVSEERIRLINPGVAGAIGVEGIGGLSKQQKEKLEEFNKTRRAMSFTLRGNFGRAGFGRGGAGRGVFAGSNTSNRGGYGYGAAESEQAESGNVPKKRGRFSKF
jgi:hypothetical protein